MQRVLRYLKGTLYHSPLFPNQRICSYMLTEMQIGRAMLMIESPLLPTVCFLDILLFRGRLKKQHVVARSSVESEYRSLAHTAAKICWLQSLFKEVQFFSKVVPIIWCDIVTVRNIVFHDNCEQ